MKYFKLETICNFLDYKILKTIVIGAIPAIAIAYYTQCYILGVISISVIIAYFILFFSTLIFSMIIELIRVGSKKDKTEFVFIIINIVIITLLTVTIK